MHFTMCCQYYQHLVGAIVHILTEIIIAIALKL